MIVRKCERCGYKGKFEYRFKLKIFILLFILTILIYALPALYYALTRRDSYRCPKCGSTENRAMFICGHCGYEVFVKGYGGPQEWFWLGVDPGFGTVLRSSKRRRLKKKMEKMKCPRCGKGVETV